MEVRTESGRDCATKGGIALPKIRKIDGLAPMSPPCDVRLESVCMYICVRTRLKKVSVQLEEVLRKAQFEKDELEMFAKCS